MAVSNQLQSFEFNVFNPSPASTLTARLTLAPDLPTMCAFAASNLALFTGADVNFSTIPLPTGYFAGVVPPTAADTQALTASFWSSLYSIPENQVQLKLVRTGATSFGNMRIVKYQVDGSQVNEINSWLLQQFVTPQTFQGNIVEVTGYMKLQSGTVYTIESPLQAGPPVPNFHDLVAKLVISNYEMVSQGQIVANGEIMAAESETFNQGLLRI